MKDANDNVPAPPENAAAGAPAQAAGDQGSGLSTAAEVEALADELTACADALHKRIMDEVRSYQGKSVPEQAQDTARALLDDEQVLRQRANALYLDAARYIVAPLGKPQAHLIGLTADAAKKIGTIVKIGNGVSLVARLLGVAAAVATGMPAPILLAFENLKHQLDYMGASGH
jgi:hypothetical protein